MVAWFIIAIATLAVFTMVAINGAQMVSNTSDATARIEVARRVDALKAAIEARMGDPSNTGLMYLPAGTQGGAGEGYLPPSGLSVSSTTPFGKKVAYCPFGPSAGAGTTITSANGSTYAVTLTSGFVTAGRPTGYARLTADPELLGYLIAPRGRTGNAAGCDQVVYNPVTQAFEAPGSVVRPLTRSSGVNELRTVNSRDIAFFVSPTGSASASGATAADPTSLAAALSFIKTRKPMSAKILFLSGTYNFADSTDFNFGSATSDDRSNGRIVLEAVSGFNTVTVNYTGGGWAGLESYGDLILKGMIFTRTTVVARNGRQTKLAGARVTGLYAEGGDIILDGADLMGYTSASDYTVNAFSGSRVQIGAGGAAIYVPNNSIGVVLYSGSSFTGGGTVTFLDNTPTDGISPSYYVHIRPSAYFAYENGTIVFQHGANYGVILYGGTFEMTSASLYANATIGEMIRMLGGSDFSMISSNFGVSGVRPASGLSDYGGDSVAEVKGFNSTVGASAGGGAVCWQGSTFAYAGNGATNGALSSVTVDEALPAMSASPTNAEVVNYTAARQGNADRAAMRKTNTSSFSCVR